MLRKVVQGVRHTRHLLIEVLLLCKDAFVEVGFLSLKAALITAKPISNKVTKADEQIGRASCRERV